MLYVLYVLYAYGQTEYGLMLFRRCPRFLFLSLALCSSLCPLSSGKGE